MLGRTNRSSVAKLLALATVTAGLGVLSFSLPGTAGQPTVANDGLETDSALEAEGTSVPPVTAQDPELPPELPVDTAPGTEPVPGIDDGAMPVEPPTELEGSELPPAETENGTIVDVATAAGSFNTLVEALEAADLVETLQGEGPFTVFAPTDEAFAALPEGTLEDLLLPENKEQLAQILSYHVVPGTFAASDLSDGEVTTVEGGSVAIVVGESVTVNDATVTQPDVEASNGVIHVVDTVLIPSS